MTNRSATLFVLLSPLLPLSCHHQQRSEESPRDGYRAFVAAIRSGDSKRIWARLGPKTKKRIQDWTRWTNKRGDLDLHPRELVVVDFPKMLPSDIRVLRQDSQHALVEPRDSSTHKIDILADGWLVRIQPLDRLPVTQRNGQVVLGPLGLRLSANRKTTTEEKFHMVRKRGRWLVELDLPGTTSNGN